MYRIANLYWSKSKVLLFSTITRKPSLAASTVPRARLSQTYAPLLMISCIHSNENKNVVILADININLMGDSVAHVNNYTNCFHGYGYESLIHASTRSSSANSGTLIDHALTNTLTPPVAFIIRAGITDHHPIALRFDCAKTHSKDHSHRTIFNKHKFREIMSCANWSRVLSCQDDQSSYSEFTAIINNRITASTSTVKCRENYSFHENTWLTPGLLKSLRKKRKSVQKN